MTSTTATQDGPGRYRLPVVGDLDLATADGFRQRAQGVLDCGDCAALVLELSGVTFADSTGLGALVAIRNTCVERQVTLTLESVARPVGRLLQLAGLDTIFDIAPG
jgi:anti-sigma B factor antagonist